MSDLPDLDWFSAYKSLRSKISPKDTYQPDDGLNYWREQIFMRVITVIVVGSTFVVGLMAILSIQLGYWSILIMDLLAFTAAFVAAFARRIKIRTRIHIFMIIIYALGLSMQLIGGPIGNGNIILFVFPIMAAVLLGLKDAAIALGINIFTMALLGILLHFGLLENTGMTQYTTIDWIGNSAGLLFFNALTAFSLSILLKGLTNSFDRIQKTQSALQESQERYQAIIEDQVDLICRTLPDGTLTFVNHAFARFFGKTPENLVGSNTINLIEPETVADIIEKLKTLNPENPVLLNTHLATSSTGEERWISWTNHGIFDDEGKLAEIQAIGQDIHDRKLTEQALQESESRYRAIVEDQIEPVSRWRPDHTLTFVNDAYCKLLNKPREALLGKSFQSAVPNEDWMIVEQMILDIKTGASSAVDESRVITPNGVRWLQWAVSAIKSEDGTLIEFQSVGHDVSEQKHVQQMLEKTLSDQIKLSKDNSELAERLEGLYLTDVNRHETQLRHLANELHDDVLNALAVVSTNLDPDETPQHVIEAYERAIQRTREIVNGLRTAMLNYGLYIGLETLADELSDQLPDGPLIYIDVPNSALRYDPDVELHLFRIVQEACNNAIKHAHASEIHICGELDMEKILLEITDNGNGFDSDDILDLPDLLRKEHFGLAGMFERAELIHGELSIHAAANEGCRVRVVWVAKNPQPAF